MDSICTREWLGEAFWLIDENYDNAQINFLRNGNWATCFEMTKIFSTQSFRNVDWANI